MKLYGFWRSLASYRVRASQMIGALAYFNCDTKAMPTAMRIYSQCMEIDAFAKAHPLKQPGAKPH